MCLKGLIASVGQGGNTSDIDLVKDLVTTYICKPSCLILLTVTCESKPHKKSFFILILTSVQPTSRTKAHITSRNSTTRRGSELSVCWLPPSLSAPIDLP
jgi:hypothetical protein